MKTCESKPNRSAGASSTRWTRLALFLAVVTVPAAQVSYPQSENQQSVSQQIRELTEAMTRAQAQLDESRRQIDEMRRQLVELQNRVSLSGQDAAPDASPQITAA